MLLKQILIFFLHNTSKHLGQSVVQLYARSALALRLFIHKSVQIHNYIEDFHDKIINDPS